MSHFLVMVIGPGIEQQLAPFQENNMGDCPPEYLAFEDCTDEVVEGFEQRGSEERKEYPTLEEYARRYHGYKQHEGRFGYWENPNAKWDYWRVGGRYSGRLVRRDGRVCDQALAGELDSAAMLERRREVLRASFRECVAQGLPRFICGIPKDVTEEQYVASARAFSCFAVLKDGKWFEKGSMGWWGMVADEKDADAWDAQVAALLAGLPADTLITMVDCHI